MHSFLKKTGPLFSVLSFLFVINILIFWPGWMTADSHSQYAMAMTGTYTDHHPPMMSVIWRFLLPFYEGSGLIFTLHLGLLYGGVAILIKAFKDSPYRFLLLFIPLMPQIFSYSMMVWKDIAFAFSFFFVLSALTFFMVKEKRPSFGIFLVLIPLLFYGAGAKYQAQFCAPFVLLAILRQVFHTSWKKTFIGTLFAALIFQIGLDTFNDHFVPQEKKDHSWQYVKLFDLAALSVAKDKDLIPDQFKEKSRYSFSLVKERFNHQRVDDLIFGPDAILKKSNQPEERTFLWKTWAQTSLSHPFSYTLHRIKTMAYVLFSIPGFSWVKDYLDSNFNAQSVSYKAIYYPCRILGTIFLAHLLVPFFSLFYLGWAFKNLSRYPKMAEPLFFINLTSLSMIALLFGMSMAGTPRYTYVSAVLTNVSHILFFIFWKTKEKWAINQRMLP